MQKFKGKYRIPSARLQQWNYGDNAAYFITICTHNRRHYFGEIKGNEMILSPVGIIADILWFEIKHHAKFVQLGEFVVMPNHIHGIIVLDNPNQGITQTNISIDKSENDGINADGDNIVDENDFLDDDHIVEKRHALSLPKQPQSVGENQPEPIGQQRFQNPGKNTISSIVGSYKSSVTRHAHRLGYEMEWQPRFYDHIIRDDAAFTRISEYIRQNPANWNADKFYQ